MFNFSGESLNPRAITFATMTRFEKDCIKERILNLARLRGTGTPADLGKKFEISERSIKRIVKEMREEGFDLRFDYACISYVLVEK